LVFRPRVHAFENLRDHQSVVGLALVTALGLTAILAWRVGGLWATAIAIASLGATLTVAGLRIVLWARAARVVISHERITVVDGWRRQSTFARGEVARIVRLPGVAADSFTIPLAIFTRADNTSIFVLGQAYDIDTIAAAVGIPVVGTWDDRMPMARVRDAYPGSVSRVAAHPWITAILVSALSMIVVIAGIFAYFACGGA
jgi:hypothetical protein